MRKQLYLLAKTSDTVAGIADTAASLGHQIHVFHEVDELALAIRDETPRAVLLKISEELVSSGVLKTRLKAEGWEGPVIAVGENNKDLKERLDGVLANISC